MIPSAKRARSDAVDQSPAAGETPSEGSTVTIVVSSYVPPEPSETPTPSESPSESPTVPPLTGGAATGRARRGTRRLGVRSASGGLGPRR